MRRGRGPWRVVHLIADHGQVHRLPVDLHVTADGQGRSRCWIEGRQQLQINLCPSYSNWYSPRNSNPSALQIPLEGALLTDG